MIPALFAFIVDIDFLEQLLEPVSNWITIFLFHIYRDIHRGFSGDDPRNQFGRLMLRWLDARMSPRNVAIVITLLASLMIVGWFIVLWLLLRLINGVYQDILSWL